MALEQSRYFERNYRDFMGSRLSGKLYKQEKKSSVYAKISLYSPVRVIAIGESTDGGQDLQCEERS
jgi:hypothetical protein